MQSLETIERTNREAVIKANIPELRNQGYHVVATYIGLHLQSIHKFKGEGAYARAQEVQREHVGLPGQRAELYVPLGQVAPNQDD